MTDDELDGLDALYARSREWDRTDVHEAAESLPALISAARRWAKAEAFLRAHGNEIVSIIRDHYYAEHSRALRALEALLKEVSHGE